MNFLILESNVSLRVNTRCTSYNYQFPLLSQFTRSNNRQPIKNFTQIKKRKGRKNIISLSLEHRPSRFEESDRSSSLSVTRFLRNGCRTRVPRLLPSRSHRKRLGREKGLQTKGRRRTRVHRSLPNVIAFR